MIIGPVPESLRTKVPISMTALAAKRLVMIMIPYIIGQDVCDMSARTSEVKMIKKKKVPIVKIPP